MRGWRRTAPIKSCSACHSVIDPVGLALENYNALGQWRAKDIDAGTAIDSGGKLADGTAVNGVNALRDYIVARPDLFVQTLTENLLTYALGRPAQYYDMPLVRRLVRDAAANDYRFSTLVTGHRDQSGIPDGPGADAPVEQGRGSDCEYPGAWPGARQVTMFITRKHLSRRTVLQGVGAAVALPLLDAMIPAATALAKTAAAPKPRLVFVYFPHGAVMDKWTPKKEGADFDLPPIIASLAPFQKQLTIISGLENHPAIAAPGACRDARHLAVLRGAAHQPRSPGRNHAGPDRRAALRPGHFAAFASKWAPKSAAVRVPATATTAAAMARPSRSAIRRRRCPWSTTRASCSSSCSGRATRPANAWRMLKENQSLLDLVSRDAADLKRSLGARDQALVDDYLTTVREIERRVDQIASRDLSTVQLPDAPAGIPSRFDEHIRLMYDMIALAFQANLTRVATYMMAAEVSNQPYNFIGISDAFHPLSHHANNPQKMDKLAQVQAWNTGEFAKFVKKLQGLPDGEGNMLDNSFILFGSNMSDSNLHNHYPLPTAIVGGGMGRLKGNQHLKYADRTPIANVHLTLLDRMGVPMEKFGDSTQKFVEI